MNIFYKILRQDRESREGVVTVVSVLSIIINLILALTKIGIGTLVSSIAIVSEGVDNLADSGSSMIAIVGTKLAQMHPTKKHPFGFGRIEYLTSLTIAVIIMVTAFEFLKTSFLLIIHPGKMTISYVTLAIIIVSVIVKLLLSAYIMKEGKRVDSGALIAVGIECRGDCVKSLITLGSSLIFLFTGYSVDAFAGFLISAFIMKAGFEILSDTLGDILGEAADKGMADDLYRIIRREPIIINAADMIIHNYGPDAYHGSVNVEIDHKRPLGEIYTAIHALQLKIMHEKNVVMVFGMYAVDRDGEEMKELRNHIVPFVRQQDHVTSYHALYIHPETRDIYCDLVVDYELRDWSKLKKDFLSYMEEHYPGRRVELVIETEFV